MDPKFRTPGTMLDIGCGAGSFLAEMRDKGMESDGAELEPGSSLNVVASKTGSKFLAVTRSMTPNSASKLF